MHQIADWLEKLGMSEYAQRFAESDIGWFTEGFDTLDLKEAKALLRRAARLITNFETASWGASNR